MITIYEHNEENFASMGMGALSPIACDVVWEEGGQYDLTLQHPIMNDGKWMMIANERILRVPSPVRESPYVEFTAAEQTESTISREIYKVSTPKGGRLNLRQGAGMNARILTSYKPGTEVEKTGQSGDWTRVIVLNGGKTGWMYTAYLKYVRTETETVVTQDKPGVIIKRKQAGDQLFRINKVDADTTKGVVNAEAQHISYDLKGVRVIGKCDLKEVPVETALSKVLSMASRESDFEIHCEISGNVTGDYTNKSILECLRDPKIGFAAQLGARVVCDNFDVWLIPSETRDMGVTLRRGKNLTGVNFITESSDRVSRIYPVGRDKDGNPLYMSGTKYIESPYAGEFPGRDAAIEYDVKVGEGDDEYRDNAAAQAELKKRAQEDMDSGADAEQFTMNVQFVDLGDTEEYKSYRELMIIHPYDTVTVIRGDLGRREKARLNKCTWDAIVKKYKSVTLGSVQTTDTTVYSFNIASGAVGSGQIAANAVGTAQLRQASIQYAKISVAAIEQLAADALTAVSAHINQLVAGTIEADQLYADLAAIAVAEITTANIEKANIDWAKITTLSAQVAEIAKAQITQANINEANIDWAKIDTLNAVIASIAQANIAAADIDFAHIKDLAAGTAIITQGVGGKLFISRLAVTEANMVSLSVGELIIKGGDGGFYALGVDADGNITTTLKQIGNSDVEDLSINAGEKLIDGSVTAATLNATDIFADSAIIRQLIAENFEVDTLWNREAWMSKINGLGGSLDLSANESIRMVVDSLSTEKSTVFRQEERPTGAGNGDLWIQPSTGRTWQYSSGAESTLRFALTDDGQLAYAYADSETAYPLVIDENGMLAIDAGARLLVDPDDVSGAWMLVTDPADPAQALDTYSGVYINKDEIHLVSQKTTVAVPGANGEDDVARFDADGVHAQIIEADEINSPSVVATQVAATYAPANAGELTAIAENLKNVCLTGNVTVDASALTGGTLTLRGVSGGYSLTISGGTINSAEMIGCTARIVFSGVTFATSGAAATVEASPNVLITGGALNAGTGVLATERSRVCVSSCGGVCDYAADSRGFAEVTFTGTVPGTDMPYGLAKFSDGGQIYAGARLISKPSAEPEPEKPTVQTVTLTPTLTRTYNGSWRDGYWLWQGRYGTLGLNRGCMWFDTSAFAGKTILSASLSLKRLSGAGSGVAVAIKICGTTAAGASGTPAVGAQYASVSIAQGARKSVDVTSAVQALANGSIRGLMLYDSSTSNLSSSNNWTACYAKLYGYDSGDRPVLTVTYQ